MNDLADLQTLYEFWHDATCGNVALMALDIAEEDYKQVAATSPAKTLQANVAAASNDLLTVEFPFFEIKA